MTAFRTATTPTPIVAGAETPVLAAGLAFGYNTLMTTSRSFTQFQSDALARGFDEVIEKRWDPGLELGPHRHDFAVEAIVTDGEMWLTVDDATRHLRAGDAFTLERDVTHGERYGDAGATVWIARRRG